MATVGRFAAVVLAAGAGARFGGGKLLANYGGVPLLHAALAAARAAPVRSITLVTGMDAGAVAACAASFDPTIRTAHAADHAEGMAASLRAGIASLEPGLDGAFVFLGDMPRVPHAVLAPLAAAVEAGAPAAAPVFAGRRGNPVVLGRTLFGDVGALRGDVGARPILQSLGAKLALVEAPDDGVLFDVDVREDLSRPRP
ncbi:MULTISPECIES: NTP transferase domain-containing protein [unclassified Phenylobacterium]|uniref:nucleotidyltransferase family protein n=1 Tax=unclassified Phenylobacterium TaxID=2640670 RepID=UPI00083B2ADF|nr:MULTISPECIES: NTP transferase domain-containing protein [unclassified Phenylobacterium]